METRIFHNPRCRKSREGLAYLKTKTIHIHVEEYMKNGLSLADLKEMVLKLNLQPSDLIRTKDEIFRKQFRASKFTQDEWLEILTEYPALLRRPVIIRGYRAVIGDPVTGIDRLFN